MATAATDRTLRLWDPAEGKELAKLEAQQGVVRQAVFSADAKLLATYGDRAPSAVPEDIDSLELAWLVHQVEQRYSVALDLSDEDLVRMSTVDSAVEVLNRTVEAR